MNVTSEQREMMVRARVARFFLLPKTKMGKYTKLAIKNTKWSLNKLEWQ
jgi:hypothetical protein